MSVTHNVVLNVDKDKVRLDQRVHVRCGDVSSQVVRCALQSGGASWTPAAGSTAKLEILKPDGTWTVTNASISGSNVSGTVPAAAMSAPGECKRAYFRIINGSAEDTTEDFYLYVYPNATQDAIESSSYSDEFKALLEASDAELSEVIDEVEDAHIMYNGADYGKLNYSMHAQSDSASNLIMLVDYTTISGKYYDAYGRLGSDSAWMATSKIPVVPGEKIIVSSGEATNWCAWFDSDEAFVSRLYIQAGISSYVVPDGVAYAGISFKKTTAGSTYVGRRTVDDTLTLRGVPADAAETGDRIEFSTVGATRVDYTTTANKYYDAYGRLGTDNNYSATNKIDCAGNGAIYVNSPAASKWCAWFAEDETFLSRLYIREGPSIYDVPSDARYVGISNTKASMQSTKIGLMFSTESDDESPDHVTKFSVGWFRSNTLNIGEGGKRCEIRLIHPIRVSVGDVLTLGAGGEVIKKFYVTYMPLDGSSSTASNWLTAGEKFESPIDGWAIPTLSTRNVYDTTYVHLKEHLVEASEQFEVIRMPKTVVRDAGEHIGYLSASLFGRDWDDDAFGSSSYNAAFVPYLNGIRQAIDAMMSQSLGKAECIPLIIHTDQHATIGFGSRFFFGNLASMVPWNMMSAIVNLGDTISNNWSSDNYTFDDPYMLNQQLENYVKATQDLPHDKRIEIIGNHDTWGPNWNSRSTGDVSIPLHYLEPYFNNDRHGVERYPDNSGNLVVYDSYRMVKYLVVACWDYTSSANHNARITTEHWNWIIAQMGRNDGYDIIVLSHQPLHIVAGTTRNSITDEVITDSSYGNSSIGTPYPDTVFTARKNKTSGTYTDAQGVLHEFDFSSCETELLCSLHGHMHFDGYMRMGTLMQAFFDCYYSNRAIHFILIDKQYGIRVWKVEIDESSAPVTHYELPFEEQAE